MSFSDFDRFLDKLDDADNDVSQDFFSELGEAIEHFFDSGSNFTDEISLKLKGSLESYMERKVNCITHLGSSVWVYGKIATDKDKGFLILLLKKALDTKNPGIYQIMCVLDSFGEKALGKSSSMFETEENIEKAKNYLEKLK